jgi:hypothetical protein
VTLRTVGLLLFAVGVAAFFVGMFSIPGEWSLHVSVTGAVFLIVGLGVLLFTLRHARMRKPHFSVLILVALAVALHAYETFAKSSEPSLGFLLWPLTPYVVCLVVATLSASSTPAFAGAATALLFDLGVHRSVFINPTGSTAGLALLFMPLWNTLVFSPLAMLAAWLLLRLRPRSNEIAP